MLKTLYLVRHGESVANAQELMQGSEGALSAEGRTQASSLAERFVRLPVEIILSSDYERAKETAQIIAETIKQPREETHLLRERRHPSVVVNKPLHHPEAEVVKKDIFENYHREGWRHSDEENFSDLKNRALGLLHFIEERKEEHLLAITHGFFLRVIVAAMVYKEELAADRFIPWMRFLQTKNTGLTVCQYDEKVGWKLLTWNDHAHLG